MPCQGQNGCKMGRMYLTPPSPYGRIYLQTTLYPSVYNFNFSINSGFLSSATLQSQEQYNKIYLFAASPLAKTMLNVENPDGSVVCNYGKTTCSQCCLSQPQFDNLICGCSCNVGDGCCYTNSGDCPNP
jgi:hypothetical protein